MTRYSISIASASAAAAAFSPSSEVRPPLPSITWKMLGAAPDPATDGSALRALLLAAAIIFGMILLSMIVKAIFPEGEEEEEEFFYDIEIAAEAPSDTTRVQLSYCPQCYELATEAAAAATYIVYTAGSVAPVCLAIPAPWKKTAETAPAAKEMDAEELV